MQSKIIAGKTIQQMVEKNEIEGEVFLQMIVTKQLEGEKNQQKEWNDVICRMNKSSRKCG
jgi:hypothetical protein